MTTHHSAASGRISKGANDRRPMILIAEDDAVQRIALARVLERGGFEVLEAENGVSAIALACAHLPDVMILDAVMPQMGGFEAIAAIRSRPGLSTTPAIVVSGLEDVEARVNALAIGADDFIVKPFDHRELLARVHAQLRVIDAWHGRLSAMTSDFREIRRRITESDRVTSPTDTARSLQAQFPEELGCGTLMIVDSTGHHEWGHQPFYPEDIVELDLLDPATRPGNTTAGGKNSDACPLCGAGTGGILLTRDAGSWANGRAVLVLGCADRPISEIQVLADEVAEACRTVFSERMRDWESDLELEAWLEQTIESKAFRIVFQPIVDMRSGRVIAQEALARFDDGTAPGEVFRAAVVLDRRVQLEVALVGLALDQAVALPDGVRIHVNVSPATAMTPEIRDLVATSTRRVVLEITENALFSSSNAETLRGSIPASCLLAADDVGAGYAGMAQLLEYRPDIVKIDRAVVTRIDRDPARQALVAGLVQYAQATRSFVIAEGIERSEEWQQLCELGVDFGQGYLFARPVGLAEAAQMAYCTRGEAAPAKRGKLRQLISS